VDATILVEVAVRGDTMVDVVVGVAGVDIAAHEAADPGERHEVMDAHVHS
jgi:hypothetical protein